MSSSMSLPGPTSKSFLSSVLAIFTSAAEPAGSVKESLTEWKVAKGVFIFFKFGTHSVELLGDPCPHLAMVSNGVLIEFLLGQRVYCVLSPRGDGRGGYDAIEEVGDWREVLVAEAAAHWLLLHLLQAQHRGEEHAAPEQLRGDLGDTNGDGAPHGDAEGEEGEAFQLWNRQDVLLYVGDDILWKIIKMFEETFQTSGALGASHPLVV
eukprot:CAMPEP_0206558230 /NCGR_PEP_ID=MMETSP0325_2-20121206/19627_1 /ASSEMBLY_ACC=CAM_ASM_000347 /TAXON_ID=2866 /ORGANISM="Crypthecodinium cohnii, Strain Seligo" /LENGTH=207 /DNA_ID=CAMNT_0054059405 /DNA_START=74 /DNA_END=698 /DNA_ORIENTATION=-